MEVESRPGHVDGIELHQPISEWKYALCAENLSGYSRAAAAVIAVAGTHPKESHAHGGSEVVGRLIGRLLLSLAATTPLVVLASLPLQMSLAEMVAQADHVLVGHVVGVDMVDGSGLPIVDGQARTGPGLNNVIRLHVAVDETLITNAKRVPKKLLVPLDPLMHYSLEQIRSAHQNDATPRLLLLEGSDFSSLKPGVFFLPVQEKDRVLRAHSAVHR
ncbi:hypothetical protein [Variovorax gossypii]